MSLERLHHTVAEILRGFVLPGRRGNPRVSAAERLTQFASHRTRVEHLAQEIIKCRVMMGTPGDVFIGVTEISTRFAESPDDVQEAFNLLQTNGVAQRTKYKGETGYLICCEP
jgi:hypothetical protein